MNKQVLSPFDCDMCAMIEDITQQEINATASDTSIRLSWSQNGSEGKDKPEAQRIAALKQAIRGRLGDRFIEFSYADNKQSVYMKYDPEEYPEEVRTKLADPDATAGSRYCRIMLEVDAIQFRWDNVNDVLKFTGGGTVTTPRTPNGKAVYHSRTVTEYSLMYRKIGLLSGSQTDDLLPAPKRISNGNLSQKKYPPKNPKYNRMKQADAVIVFISCMKMPTATDIVKRSKKSKIAVLCRANIISINNN